MRRLVGFDGLVGARGFPADRPEGPGLFAVRHGEGARVYVNACPHLGLPLNGQPDRFLSADGRRIVCSTHGAEFRIEDGLCLSGPCRGEHLEQVRCEIVDGMVLVRTTRPD